MPTNEQFRSSFTAVLTLAGVAIGLGNVWRFPYMMGSHGGSAFLVVYVLVLILFALPVLICEWSLGRHTQEGPMRTYPLSLGTAGKWLALILVIGIYVADSYYMVVIGVFVTALYSFRMFFLVFHGEGPRDTHAQKHLHESPKVVTVPLILLAIPSVVIGWFTVGPMLFHKDPDGNGFFQSSHDV